MRFRILIITLLLSIAFSHTFSFYGYGGVENKISLVVIDSDSYIVSEAIKKLKNTSRFKVRFFTESDLSSEEALDWLKHSRAIIVDIMDDRLADFVIEKILPSQNSKSIKVYAVRSSRRDEELKKIGFIFDPSIKEYYNNLSLANVINMILKVANKTIDPAIRYSQPVKNPRIGIYHPEVSKIFANTATYLKWYKNRKSFKDNSPWIGVMFFSSFLTRGQRSVIDYLIRQLEKEGFSVIAAFGSDEEVLKRFFSPSDSPKVELILAFSLKFSSSLNPRVANAIRMADVPIINLINLYMTTIDEWYKSKIGIHLMEVAWTMANPEVSGLIEPSVISGKIKRKDEEINRIVYYHKAIKENIDFLIPRLKKWVELRHISNSRKKIAILYYNHSQGKQNIGASYLNTFRSIGNILKRLKQEGYTINENITLNEDTIRNLILKYGRNIGSWAPGELDELIKSGNVIELPIETYLKWYSRLPENFRKAVEKQWGKPAESTIMVKNGNFIIPAITLGNVVLMPEPARGWGDDPMKLYHSHTLYPHHQYIAAYLWLKYGFNANAMIHLGTHATHEWLPGKQAGLSITCPPEVLITDIPNIYPYIVDDVGEAIQAKRRGRGVIIDHLTPPIRKSNLYGEYSELYEKIQKLNQSKTLNSLTKEAELQEIFSILRKLGIDKELGIENLNEDALEHVEHYLLKLRNSFMPYGLHTFGVSPKGEALKEMVETISDANAKIHKEEILNRIKISGQNEMNSLMLALSGRFIQPGEGNDPLRNVNALPTGRNLYGLNPEKIPTKEAYKVGRKIAKQIIEKNLKENGKYPEKVAVVLWAVETIRNGGVNESVILHLLGIEPLWDRSGRVVGLKPVPGKLLKRPRIDVLINPSGLYRDLFPEKLKFLDKAVKMAMIQEDIENFLKEHSELIRKDLIKRGYSRNEADKLSKIRIFSEPSDSYGTGVAEMTGLSGVWEKDDEIAEVYFKRVGYAFGENAWGKESRDAFEANLNQVDNVVHSFSSNIYGAMDNDDVFQYAGGLTLAVRKVRGKSPKTLIALQRKPGESEIQDLSKVLGAELRTRYLNPKWIDGMKEEKYAGAREMSKFVEYFWGFQVTTPEAVNEKEWKQIFEVYVEDKYKMNIKEFFDKYNPWAYQSITARMLEAIRKGYWKAGDEIKRKLAIEYASSVTQKGVACCDHTCNNPFLNQMVVNILSIPGLVKPEVIKKFQATMEKAIGKSVKKQMEIRKEEQAKLQKSISFSKKRKNSEKLSKYRKVEGYKAKELNDRKKEETSFSSSGVQWILLAFVLGFILIFTVGFKSARRYYSYPHNSR